MQLGGRFTKLATPSGTPADDYRAEKMMFVIITDGEENSSREYTSDKIKAQIEHQKTKYGWEFIFLGANIDAVQTAERFGISADRAIDYVPDSVGTNLNFKVMAEAVVRFRESGVVEEETFAPIKADMKRRGGRK